MVLGALLDSFRWLPPGQVRFTGELAPTLSAVAAQSFTLSVRVAAPVLAALLLATLVLGLISRVLPALNAFSIGLNMNALALTALLALSLGGVAWLFEEQATATVQAVMETLGSPPAP
jgi:flagellar biosynthetic protein FliR